MRRLGEFKEGEASKSRLKEDPIVCPDSSTPSESIQIPPMASQSCPAWLPPSSFVSPGLTVFRPCALRPSLISARGLGSGISFFLKCPNLTLSKNVFVAPVSSERPFLVAVTHHPCGT